MEFEIDSIHKNQTWKHVDLPLGNDPSLQSGFLRLSSRLMVWWKSSKHD
jgi:hypothetical protein